MRRFPYFRTVLTRFKDEGPEFKADQPITIISLGKMHKKNIYWKGKLEEIRSSRVENCVKNRSPYCWYKCIINHLLFAFVLFIQEERKSRDR